MKAIVITKFGGPEVLKIINTSIPSFCKDEILVKVYASGINKSDILQRRGIYSKKLFKSNVPGLEISGKIIDGNINKDNNPFNLKIGDNICALVSEGGYAEYVSVPILQCLPIPKGTSYLEAGSIPETFFTAWSNLFIHTNIKTIDNIKNKILLVHGGSGGLGVAIIQIANSLGFRVFTTASSEEKCKFCESIGAIKAINYIKEDFVNVINLFTNNYGVDIVIDIIGGNYISRELSLLAYGGKIILIALKYGVTTEINLSKMLLNNLTITGSVLRTCSVEFKHNIALQLKKYIWPLIENKIIKTIICNTFSFLEVSKAHKLIESKEHIGKIMLKW